MLYLVTKGDTKGFLLYLALNTMDVYHKASIPVGDSNEPAYHRATHGHRGFYELLVVRLWMRASGPCPDDKGAGCHCVAATEVFLSP